MWRAPARRLCCSGVALVCAGAAAAGLLRLRLRRRWCGGDACRQRPALLGGPRRRPLAMVARTTAGFAMETGGRLMAGGAGARGADRATRERNAAADKSAKAVADARHVAADVRRQRRAGRRPVEPRRAVYRGCGDRRASAHTRGSQRPAALVVAPEASHRGGPARAWAPACAAASGGRGGASLPHRCGRGARGGVGARDGRGPHRRLETCALGRPAPAVEAPAVPEAVALACGGRCAMDGAMRALWCGHGRPHGALPLARCWRCCLSGRPLPCVGGLRRGIRGLLNPLCDAELRESLCVRGSRTRGGSEGGRSSEPRGGRGD